MGNSKTCIWELEMNQCQYYHFGLADKSTKYQCTLEAGHKFDHKNLHGFSYMEWQTDIKCECQSDSEACCDDCNKCTEHCKCLGCTTCKKTFSEKICKDCKTCSSCCACSSKVCHTCELEKKNCRCVPIKSEEVKVEPISQPYCTYYDY